DGVPSPAADGDDTNGDDDEDGVTFQGLQVGSNRAEVIVDAQNISTEAYIDAWVDFDGDGNWGGALEQIAASVPATEGSNTIEFAIPAEALAGEAVARVRISSSGQLGHGGEASDGEVEDYFVQIGAPASASLDFTSPIAFEDNTTGNSFLAPADLDQDGDTDIVLGRGQFGWMAWLENDGSGGFATHQIQTSLLSPVFTVGDMDGDGDMDLFVGSGSRDKVAWLQNDGMQNFSEIEISDTVPEIASIQLADSDGDGDLDGFVMTGFNDARVLHYENQNGTFVESLVLSNVKARDFEVIDVDRDGDYDFVASVNDFAVPDDGISWYENTGSGYNPFVLDVGSYSEVLATDIDGDGDIDILGNEGAALKLFVNDGDESFTSVIIGDIFAPRDLKGGDFDGDGDVDLAIIAQGSSATDEPFTHFLLENTPNNQFIEHLLTQQTLSANTLVVADIDGDADLDLVHNRFPNGVYVLENINGIAPRPDSFTPRIGAGMVAPEADLSVTFDQTIEIGEGEITIHLASDDSVLAQLDVASDAVTVDGDRVTIDPPTDLPIDAEIYVLLPPKSFVNSVGDAFQGMVIPRWGFQTINPGTDYGDAPDASIGNSTGNYQTTIADGGPSHVLSAEVYLGYGADPDDGSLQSPDAKSDDRSLLRSDEDGVRSPTDLLITAGTTPTISVTATNFTGAPVDLMGWIDFNRDGVFGAGESAVASVADGQFRVPTTLVFPTAPADLQGATYLRLRIGPDVTSLGSTGASIAGEVEDHLVTFLQPGLGVGGSVVEIADGVNGGPDLNTGDSFGHATAPIGDIDGDGIVDVAFGVRNDDEFRSNAGAVYIGLLNADGTLKSVEKHLPDDPDLRFSSNNWFGQDVAPAGDLDGDGVPDVAVLSLSVGGDPVSGLSFLYMNSDGTVREHVNEKVFIDGTRHSFDSLASIGDLNGDGLSDYALGDANIRVDGDWFGGVYIMFGGVDGYGDQFQLITNGIGGGPMLDSFGGFGESITAIGDLDGDGVTELAVGAPSDDATSGVRGALFILMMNPDGTVKSHHKISQLDSATPVLNTTSSFGRSVDAIGDRDGDGNPDLIVAAGFHQIPETSNVGAAFTLFLNADGTLRDYTPIGLQSGPEFDFLISATALGDINGDGQMDVAFGNERGGPGDKGSVQIMFLDPVQPPTDIELTNPMIEEAVDTGAGDILISTLSVTDASTADSHTYELVAGEGDDNNDQFAVAGPELFLRQGSVIDFQQSSTLQIRLRVTDSTNQSYEESFVIEVLNIPEVLGVEVNEGQPGRSQLTSIEVRFDGPVADENLAAAFAVTNRSQTGTDPTTSFSVDHSAGQSVVTIGFVGTVADGNYQLTVDSSLVFSDRGTAMREDFRFGESATDSFFRYFGDSDGDRDVDGQDYGRFALGFGQVLGDPNYDRQLDFDFDGDIDGQDYGQFSLNFLGELPFN
ncbi:MAG: FG-GAP-like repeat-containing protein, partial [Planctomycetota bacterium]